jgi:superfamily II DNA or RNA helicase
MAKKTAAATKPKAPKGAPKAQAKKLEPSNVPFSKRLVLFQYLLATLGVDDFETLRAWLKDPEREGVDEEGVSRFCRTLIAQLRPADEPGRYRIQRALEGAVADRFDADATAVGADDLLRYDGYILGHTRAISRARPSPVQWKYYQYLALLFVEIYLERWFKDAEGLCAELNEWVKEHDRARRDNLPPYELDDLRTLALWCATGSGKTLLMHVNLLQFRHALGRFKKHATINRTLLVTPGESLSRQHLDELARSGIAATVFSRGGTGGLFRGRAVEVLETSKLAETDGEKTVAVDSFESNNLVLIDEGHHGSSGEVIRGLRNRLSADGFAFEYSATFGQAMKAAKKPELEASYARAVVFDYAYRRFYADGYGKDFRVLNVDDGGEEALHHRYLVACLVAFYQQLRIYEESPDAVRTFQIERPLWIFVGSSVKAIRTVHGQQVSDVQRVLRFLARFVREETESVDAIGRLLDAKGDLHDARGRDLFENEFTYLAAGGASGATVYRDVLKRVFHAAAAAKMHVERLEGTDGEIALRLGDAEPFGLVNVGDASGFMKLLKKSDAETFVLTDRPVAAPLFDRLRAGETGVNILVGSQKFATGWDTARVSTMGLMNIGKGEGSQIIQLFGRGVRLRGYGNSLKRSSAMVTGRVPPVPKYLRCLETLQVFGVSADYMATFEQYLRDEEVPVAGEAVIEVPVEFVELPSKPPLKTIRVKEGELWQRDGSRPRFGEVGRYLTNHRVKLDWYPRLRAVQSDGVYATKDESPERRQSFGGEHIACLDLDALVQALDAFCESKGWTQVDVTREGVAGVLGDKRWYELQAPPETLALDDPSKVPVWHEIAQALLLKYMDRIAKVSRSEWEGGRIEYATVTRADSNLQLLTLSDGKSQGYQVTVSVENETLVRQIREIASRVREDAGSKLRAIVFGRHLFSPLLWVPGGKLSEVSVKPVALNEGEGRFVGDLKAWCAKRPEWFASRALYLLRNRAVSGVGFFDEGGFYPDFILWVIQGDHQDVVFIDPKGIRNLETTDDAKIQLHKRIKEIETQLGDAGVSLHSFIISNTALQDVNWRRTLDVEGFAREHVYFQDQGDYIDRLVGAVVGGA